MKKKKAKKNGFFRRLFNVFRRKRRKRKTNAYEMYSRFRRYIDECHPNDPLYPSVRQTADLCDDALKSAKARIKLSERIHDLDGKMTELSSYSSLSDEDAKEIKTLLDYYIAVSEERSQLHEQLTQFDPSLAKMFQLEEDAINAMASMKNAEHHQRILKQDLGYIHGEKEELVYDRDNMEAGLSFIHKFNVGIVVVFTLVTGALAYMSIVGGRNIFWPAAIFIVLAAVIIGLLYAFRRKLRREMKRNKRKQHRAVELLNKKNVVFAYYTNYLRYTYRKYKVRNTKMLASHLEDFGKYKALLKRIDNLRQVRYETEDTIERFLREKKLTGVKSTIEGFARTVNLEDKRRYFSQLKEERAELERQLGELDTRHEEIWDVLLVLAERDDSEEKIVEQIIQTYLDEAAKAFKRAGMEAAAKGTADETDGDDAIDDDVFNPQPPSFS
jgi:uncharacterized membrane protein